MRQDYNFGIELEWADVDRSEALPYGWTWCNTEVHVVNSDGTACDPKGQLPVPGGEVKSPVCNNIDSALSQFEDILRQLKPVSNYRGSVHIHLSRRGRNFNLQDLKTIADTSRRYLYGDFLRNEVMPVWKLDDGTEEVKSFLRWSAYPWLYHKITDERHDARMDAESIEEMLAAEVPHSKDGKPQWHLGAREALNFRAFRKHGTIEYRFFSAPTTVDGLRAAIEFAMDWTDVALMGFDPRDTVRPILHRLPPIPDFTPGLEYSWKRFNFKDNARSTVIERLREEKGYDV